MATIIAIGTKIMARIPNAFPPPPPPPQPPRAKTSPGMIVNNIKIENNIVMVFVFILTTSL